MIAERMNAALNAHDIDAFVALFAPDSDSVQPAHPRPRLRRRRAGAHELGPRCSPACRDFRAELIRATTDGDTDVERVALVGNRASRWPA